ncbi:MAG: flagellar motor switch protein FliN [Pseudomonadota bacterium]
MPAPQNPALAKTLMDVPVQVDIVLGEARIPIEDLQALDKGDVVALERQAKEPVDIYVSDRLMARGKLVIADGELGVTLTEIIDEPAQI